MLSSSSTISVILFSTGLFLYLLASILLWFGLRGTTRFSGWPLSSLILPALLIHGFILYRTLSVGSTIHLSLGLTISIAGWVSAILYYILALRLKSWELGLVVLPATSLTLIAGSALMDNTLVTIQFSRDILWHIALAVPTYAVMCTAFAQAILLILQDRQLHRPLTRKQMTGLPAIQTMETSLFWLTTTGFLLMTMNLVSGAYSSLILHDQTSIFTHHIIFSIIAWACFGSLVAGRLLAGWRGGIAARWTVAAFFILLLAYFGTRFVREFLLVSI